MFCVYSFPVVIFSWLSQSNRRLFINPCSYVWLWELNRKEGWTPKNWCFQTVVLEKTPECPLDSKEIKPVNLKEINPEYSLEGLMLRLKRQYFAHLMRTADSSKSPWCWERLRAEREGVRGWDSWMASPIQWTWTWANFGRWWGIERPGMLQSMGSQRVGQAWATEQQQPVRRGNFRGQSES